jgi:hypothetical protein
MEKRSILKTILIGLKNPDCWFGSAVMNSEIMMTNEFNREMIPMANPPGGGF